MTSRLSLRNRMAAFFGRDANEPWRWVVVDTETSGLDPVDPIRFDFALSRLGILGLLPAPGGRLARRHLERALDVLAAGAQP